MLAFAPLVFAAPRRRLGCRRGRRCACAPRREGLRAFMGAASPRLFDRPRRLLASPSILSQAFAYTFPDPSLTPPLPSPHRASAAPSAQTSLRVLRRRLIPEGRLQFSMLAQRHQLRRRRLAVQAAAAPLPPNPPPPSAPPRPPPAPRRSAMTDSAQRARWRRLQAGRGAAAARSFAAGWSPRLRTRRSSREEARKGHRPEVRASGGSDTVRSAVSKDSPIDSRERSTHGPPPTSPGQRGRRTRERRSRRRRRRRSPPRAPRSSEGAADSDGGGRRPSVQGPLPRVSPLPRTRPRRKTLSESLLPNR